MESKPSIFISYSQTDAAWAKELSKDLERRGFRVFLSSDLLLPGANWRLEVGKALESANAMVVLLSPASNNSLAVRQDIQYALGAERFQGRLIAVEVEPTQNYPWILGQLNWIPARESVARAGDRIEKILQAAGEPDVHAGTH
jgi:hypothetical protein